MTRKVTMREAWKRLPVRQAAHGFAGCPFGGWPETGWAWRNLLDVLPRRDERTWGARDLMDAVLYLDHADRYQAYDDADERVKRASSRRRRQ